MARLTGPLRVERRQQRLTGKPRSTAGAVSGRLKGLGLLALAASGVWTPAAYAQQTTLSLDDQLRDVLALGDATGCFDFLRVVPNQSIGESNQAAVNRTVDSLLASGDISTGIGAICGSSAVNSASSLGGALNASQSTKTVAQFKVGRKRLDQRLRDKKRTAGDPVMLAWLDQASVTDAPNGILGAGSPAASGFGVFGEAEYETSERETTRLESGYEADITGGTLGADYAWGDFVVGAWAGLSTLKADFEEGDPIVEEITSGNVSLNTFLSDRANLLNACGGIAPGGEFDIDTTRLGGFAGMRIGEYGFVDVSASYGKRDYDYTRNVCAIEYTPAQTGGQYVFVPDASVGGHLHALDPGETPVAVPGVNPTEIDDRYAGRISGATEIQETSLSLRGGFDMPMSEAWVFGPRAAVTFTKSEMDAYSETGLSTVANSVQRNDDNKVTTRALNAPTGLELAYDAQDQESVLLEFGAETFYRFDTDFGAVIPFLSAYYRRELEDDVRSSRVHMAQDFRDDPFDFVFATDAPDSDNVLISVGATALFGDRAAAQIEVSTLAMDDLINSTSVSAQFRMRF